MIRLHANENPYERHLDDLAAAIGGLRLNEYPDEEALELRQAVSTYTGWPLEGIVCGNGSDELIKMCVEAFVLPGEKVLSHGPTFVEYRVMTEIRNAIYIEALPNEALNLNQAAFMALLEEEQPSLVFLCNPNNPTGEKLTASFIEKVIEKAPGMVVLDEAYTEFGLASFIKKLPKYQDKLILLRTLSKAFGLAALRVGYAMTSESNAAALNRVRMPYNVTAVSQALGAFALKNPSIMEAQVALIRSERNRVYDMLSQIRGIEPLVSETNFILIRTKPEWVSQIQSVFESKGYSLRFFEAQGGLGAYFRITIGKPENNDAVLSILKEVMTSCE